MKIEFEVGGKILLHADSTLNFQFGLIEIRMRRDVELTAVGDRVGEEIPGALIVQSQVLEMDMRFERWLCPGATDASREIGRAIHGEAAGLEPRETAEADISPGKIQRT